MISWFRKHRYTRNIVMFDVFNNREFVRCTACGIYVTPADSKKLKRGCKGRKKHERI